MPNIQILDQNTINQIAAGEVIERPASVVKELLENAIDAKATAVTVEIKEGGISFIRITDNGSGIEKEEIPLAFLRHSTSKIRSVEDLLTVSSLGFRGEALSSIASVAQVELITKTPSSLHGVRYEIEGGEEKSFEEIGSPDGTTFLVRNLFYNTPVRRKFLKTAQTEAGYIGDIVERLALSHPEISVRFINNGQNKLHTSGNHNLKDVIYTIFGRDITSNLLPIDASLSYLSLKGFIGKPVISRGNRTFENYYVNGRYIRSDLISRGIEEAYQSFLMQHKYPFTVLNLQIDPDLLDVNVHPTKMDLRFRKSEEIYAFLVNSIREALSRRELIPEMSLSEKRGQSQHHVLVPPERKQRESTTIPPLIKKDTVSPIPEEKNLFVREPIEYANSMPPDVDSNNPSQTELPPVSSEPRSIHPSPSSQDKTPVQMELFDDKLLERKNREKHRIVGQIFNTYWLVEFKDTLFLIDQHAAHEKVLFEKTMTSLKTNVFSSQIVNPPLILTLTMSEEAILNEYRSTFTNMGFEIEPFGGKEYAIRAVPDNLLGLAERDVFLEMLGELPSDIKPENIEQIYDKVASMSCKAAVKGNHHLTMQEAQNLIDELLELKNPYHCPHGRPILISMSKREIEKKFKRIV